MFMLAAVFSSFALAAPAVLAPDLIHRHVAYFNAMEDEPIVNAVPNAQAAAWMQANVPLFESPDAEFDQTYYFRWWALRKHLRKAPDGSPALAGWNGYVFTEFINRASPVSSALGHHLMDGRWLHDSRYHDDYVRYWLRGDGGKPIPALYMYSSWLQFALYQRYLVNRTAPSFSRSSTIWCGIIAIGKARSSSRTVFSGNMMYAMRWRNRSAARARRKTSGRR
jgi:hypothetical protein